MLSLWIRLVTVTGEPTFYALTCKYSDGTKLTPNGLPVYLKQSLYSLVFLLAYYIIAVMSFLSLRQPMNGIGKVDVPFNVSSTNESVDPLLVP